MSRYDNRATNRAVALKYEGEGAPVVVASGMGYLAERMVEVFLATEFEGGRHARRVEKMMALEG